MRLNKVSRAVLYALATTSGAVIAAEADVEKKEIESIMVTATKRTQNIQETPLAVQAMSAAELKEMNVGNFDDFVRYMPNITVGARGPGQADIFIRGMAVQPIAVMLSGAQGTMPNVALYIDEQPVTAPGRNLDVYATDLERIEVLPGPQGTLFGASSQAGTIRYITKKPDLSGFGAGVNASVSSTKNGGVSQSLEGYFNLPVTDDLAVRATFYNVQRAGYIDNVYGEFSIDPQVNPLSSVNLPDGTTYENATNADLVEEDFNDSFYKGFRLGVNYQINDDWKLLVQHTQQQLGSDGVFDYDPDVGDLQVTRFFPDQLEDEFGQTSWTLEGRLAALELVYTGAYLDRDVEQSIDYTGYNNAGAFIAYYTCTYTNPDYIVNYNISPDLITENRECKDPTKGFRGTQEHKRFTHEFRVATDSSKEWRVVAGIFMDDVEIETQDDYWYMSTTQLGFAPNAPISTANSINDAVRPAGVAFFNDITRTEEQIAIFGELAYDLREDLTLSLGLRWYEIESDFTGSSNFADGIFQGSQNTDRGRDYDVSGGHTDEPLKIDDVITKVNVSYKLQDNVMLYATYSEGFRPGGFNRGGGVPSVNPAYPQVDVTYDTDDVKNYEFGWKAMLLDNTLRFNGNTYFIQWDNMQVSRFDPQNVSNLTFIENAADSEIFGIEAETVWNATNQLTLIGALSYNSTEITKLNAEVIEMAPVGSALPMTPEIQGNLRANYMWEMGEYFLTWQSGIQYAGDSWSSIVASEREQQDAYTLVNTALVVEKDNWSVRLFVDNLTDERAELFINTQDDIRRVTTNRPMTVGLSFSFDYY